MSTSNRKQKVVIGIMIVIICLIIIIRGCINIYSSKADNNTKKCDITLERDTNITLQDGKYTIERNLIEKEIPMGEYGVWTIYIYMCGSDYESKHGAASKDIKEILAASMSSNVRVVLQTGGSKKWHNNKIDADKIQRFVIQNGKMNLVDEKNICDVNGKKRSLGKPDELYDFLSWGVSNYASSHMGLILWNHGGGSVDGICYDENNDMESLKIAEVELALCNTRKDMTSRFEFIGFDACIMQNIETANLMVPYAKYMVGSETPELEKGFDYKNFIEYISKHKDASTLDVCKKLCDYSYEAYLKSITGVVSSGSVVFSVIDLEKVDKFLYDFNSVAKELSDSINTDRYYSILNNIENSTRFGAGQIDILDLLSNIEDEIVQATFAKKSLEDVIKYTKKSKVLPWYNNATGLSMFISSEYAQIQNYNNLINVAITPYIMNYCESIVYGECYGDLELYNKNKEDWTTSLKYYSNDFSFVDGIFENEKEYVDNYVNNYKYNANSIILNKWRSALNKKTGISILDDTSNIICDNVDNLVTGDIIITDNSIDKVSNVRVKVFSKVYNELEGSYVYKELGDSSLVEFNRDKGEIKQQFNGKWLMLPNGLPLAVAKTYRYDNYIRQISPCYINNKYVYLYSILNLNDNSVEIEGYADTYSNSSIQTKILNELKVGDCVQPMFMYTKNIENGAIFKDSEMNYGFCDVKDDFALTYTDCKEEMYISVILEDVFGTDIYTPITKYLGGQN